MSQLNSLKSTWDEYKGWFFLALAIYVIWCFRGFIQGLGDLSKSGLDATLGGLKKSAEDKADKAKATAANGNKDVDNFSDEDVARFKSDAESLANFLGRGPGFGMVDIVKDQASAFGMMKGTYSYYQLYNNRPFKWGKDKKGNRIRVPQTEATKDSAQHAVSWRVLVPFYKDYTNGHDLASDYRYYVTKAPYKALEKWILG